MTSPLAVLERTFRPIDPPLRPVTGCRDCGVVLAGVYLLVKRDEIVYIGSTADILRRLYAHVSDRRRRQRFSKRFDRVLWLELPAAVIAHYEGALVRALRPPGNSVVHVRKFDAHDAEILYGLGLRDELAIDEIAWEAA